MLKNLTPDAYKAGAPGAVDSVPAPPAPSEDPANEPPYTEGSIWGPIDPALPGYARYSPIPVPDDVAEMTAMGHLLEASEKLVGPSPAEDLAKVPKRRRGRPRGRKFSTISISIDDQALHHVDALAAERGASRSAVIRDIVLGAWD